MSELQHERLTGSKVVTQRPVAVYSITVNASTAADSVVLYDDTEAATTRPVQTVKAAVTATQHLSWSYPLIFHRGLYVAFGTNVDDCNIQYGPLPVDYS